MLEFLKECCSENMYKRAMDCEQKINTFDNISPMATFLETSMKQIYFEIHKELTIQKIDKMKFYQLLSKNDLKAYLKKTYGFEDKHNIIGSEIRLYSNDMKHSSSHVVSASPEKVKQYFQCTFNFAAHYYATKTKHSCPKWDENAYQNLLVHVDTNARKKHLQFENDIIFLRKKLEEQKSIIIETKKKIKELEEQLKNQILENINPSQAKQQQDRIKLLKQKLDTNESQKYVLSDNLKKIKNEKKKLEQELKKIKKNIERVNDVKAEQLLKKQQELNERLVLANQLIETLNSQNSDLKDQINKNSEEKKVLQQELYEMGRQLADSEKLLKTERKLYETRQERDIIQQQFDSIEKELKSVEGQLFTNETELNKKNQEYLEIVNELLEISNEIDSIAPKCPNCGSTLIVKQQKNGNGYFWACPLWKSNCVGHTELIPPNIYEKFEKKNELEKKINVKSKLFKLLNKELKKYQVDMVTFEHYPRYLFSVDTYFFQSISVPSEIFEQRNFLGVQDFSQFRLHCNIPKMVISLKERIIYSLSLRILNRGIVLCSNERVSSELEKKFNKSEIGTVNALYNGCTNPQNFFDTKQDFSDIDNKYTEIDDRYLVACKFVHQFEISITKALEQGHIPNNCNLQVCGKNKLFSESELQFILTIAVLEIQKIFEQYNALYGLEFKWNLLDKTLDKIDITIIDEINNKSKADMIIQDCYFSYNYQGIIAPFEQTVSPKNFNKEILLFFLQYLFNHKEFREGQYEAITRLLHREDSVILLPTGAGKSIIYQLSSFLVPGLTIVISPLISLIEDQILNLDFKFGINNALSIPLANKIEDYNAMSLLYISPERLLVPSFRNILSKSIMLYGQVYVATIDEAHCISEWGHDFRPAYLNIGNSIRRLFQKNGQSPVIIALTGTASDAVLKDIQRSLSINEEQLVLPDSFDRKELHFRVYECSSEEKIGHIADIIKKELPSMFGSKYNDFICRNDNKTNAGLIFAPLVDNLRASQYSVIPIQAKLTNILPEAGIASYFSKTPSGYDAETWKATLYKNALDFKKNKLNLLVATKAFGMGIDKENIRYVIHNGIPSSFEAYYQEAGRAGRDRKKSECILLFSSLDETLNETLLDPALTLTKFIEKYNEITKENPNKRDDLSSILYFHISSFQGVEKEYELASQVLNQIWRINPQWTGKVHFPLLLNNNNEKGVLEKKYQQAMVRFSILGLIQDYTYDYPNESFELNLGSATRENIIEKYIEYISWNSKGRSDSERQKFNEISEEGLDFIKKAVYILIEYIYDNIEQSRRRAIREMYMTVKEATALLPDEQNSFLRERVSSYFKYKGTLKNELQTILMAEKAGLHIILNVFTFEINKDKFAEKEKMQASKINIIVGRMLESNPDHPGLLFTQALAEIIVGDYSEKIIANDIVAAAKYALERYSVPKEDLISILNKILNLALNLSIALFDTIFYSLDGDRKKDMLEQMIISKDINDVNREYLLYSYVLDCTNRFLKGDKKE